jgi:chromosome partitioning protein
LTGKTFNTNTKLESMKPQIFAISNHKGGVAKTSTTVNLGAGLALMKKRVLLIDLDPQGNLSQSFGIKDAEPNMYNALKGQCPIPEVKVNENLWLSPSNLNLSGAELELSMEPGRENLLKRLLAKTQNQYDYILCDCPPSLGLLTVNALNAADKVLIPLQAQFLASQGLAKLMDIIAKVKDRLNPELSIGGIIITMYKKNTVLSRDVVEFTSSRFADLIFNTKIRDNIAIAEAPASGMDIFRYSKNSLGALDYSNLCMEFFNRFEK